MKLTGQRTLLAAFAAVCLFVAFGLESAAGQVKNRLAIATGGTGGVYYPLGGGLAALMSKHLPGVEATAEVTTAAVDNMKLLHGNRVAVVLTLPDTAYDASQGKVKGLTVKKWPSGPSRPFMRLHADRRNRRQQHQERGGFEGGKRVSTERPVPVLK